MTRKIIFSVLILLSIVSIFVFPPASYLLLTFGVGGLLFDLFEESKKLKAEIHALNTAIDSICLGAEPEILNRTKSFSYLSKTKTNVYEVVKLINNDVLFLKNEVLNSINIPVYINNGTRIFKNRAMNELCMELDKEPDALGDEVFVKGINYRKIKTDDMFYFIPDSPI